MTEFVGKKVNIKPLFHEELHYIDTS